MTELSDAATSLRRPDVRDPYVRLPDERARFRAAVRAAGAGGLCPLERSVRPRGRPGRVQHLRGAGERRQPALRQPQPAGPDQATPAGDADRGRRLSGPEGSEPGDRQGSLGRRRLRHPQPGQPAGAAGTGPAQPRGSGRDPGPAAELSVRPAQPAGFRLLGLGLGVGRLRQHLHVLHRAEPARQGDRPPSRRRAGRDRDCWSPTGSARSPCSGRTSTPTAAPSATRWPSASCCAPAARSTDWTGCDSPVRIRATSPTT